jgi:hypothetical protein
METTKPGRSAGLRAVGITRSSSAELREFRLVFSDILEKTLRVLAADEDVRCPVRSFGAPREEEALPRFRERSSPPGVAGNRQR